MADVYFVDLRATSKLNLLKKLSNLLDAAAVGECITSGDLVCIKMHFGEHGNCAYIPPIFIRELVKYISQYKAKAFLCDTNVAYAGWRTNAVDHIHCATAHGFCYCAIGVPIIIGDGLRGKAYIDVQINKKHFKKAQIGEAILSADVIINVAHFKGHALCGFGGVIKNLGMGCAARAAKFKMHSDIAPQVDESKCGGCGRCFVRCPVGALALITEKVSIDSKRCVGCGACVAECPNEAIEINWEAIAPSVVCERIVEYAYAVATQKKDKLLHINFVINVSPECDCCTFNDAPVVADVGILCSKDMVACDKAAVDLVNAQSALKNSAIKTAHAPGADKFKDLYPNIDYLRQLEYAQELELGSMEYTLKKIQ